MKHCRSTSATVLEGFRALLGQGDRGSPDTADTGIVVSKAARIVILMGVAGSGKTTIGRLLAKTLGWQFYDGDDYHPKANVDKMSRGRALTDEDRARWLTALQDLIRRLLNESQSAVLACSALKQAYRDRLKENQDEVVFVHLKASYEVLHQRLRSRKDHFMKGELLASQFDTLEEPKCVLVVNMEEKPQVIVKQIERALRLSRI